MLRAKNWNAGGDGGDSDKYYGCNLWCGICGVIWLLTFIYVIFVHGLLFPTALTIDNLQGGVPHKLNFFSDPNFLHELEMFREKEIMP